MAEITHVVVARFQGHDCEATFICKGGDLPGRMLEMLAASRLR